MPVSVAEKTLEHWTSQYIQYRFKAQAEIWWPPSGVDIDVQSLPLRPGKFFSFELKTSTYNPRTPDQHKIYIDLGQLWKYLNKPRFEQPFYVFPLPDWPGDLAAFATASNVRPSDMAFARSGEGWWFADWMYVLTLDEVVATVQGPLRAHAKESKKPIILAHVTPRKYGRPLVTWASGRQPVRNWLSFWEAVIACGEPGWPQQFIVASKFVSGGSVTHRQAREALRMSGAFFESGEDLSLLRATPDGHFESRPLHREGVAPVINDDGIAPGHFRVGAFLDARLMTNEGKTQPFTRAAR